MVSGHAELDRGWLIRPCVHSWARWYRCSMGIRRRGRQP